MNLGMSYNIPTTLSLEYLSHSIKIEDLNSNTFNPFDPISIRNVLDYAQEVKFRISEY